MAKTMSNGMETDAGSWTFAGGGDEATSTPVPPDVAHEEMRRAFSAADYAERAAKVIDLKALCKPPVLTGDGDWPD